MDSDYSDEGELLSINGDSDVDDALNIQNERNDRQEPARQVPQPGIGNNSSSESNKHHIDDKSDGDDENLPSTSRNQSFQTQESAKVSAIIISDDEDSGSEQRDPEPPRSTREMEITLSDDDDENDTNSPANSSNSRVINSSESPPDEQATATSSRYGLRRKRKINYEEIENGPSAAEGLSDRVDKTKAKKEILDIFSLSTAKIDKYIRNPDLIDNFTKCKIVFMHGTDSSRLNTVAKFFQKCGSQFQSLFVQIRSDTESYTFLRNVLKSSRCLTRLDYRYQNVEDASNLLDLLKEISNQLSSLASLKLISVSGSSCLREAHYKILSELPLKFQSVELGDALWEDVKAETIETFLQNQKSCLTTLIIHGGFRGDMDKEKRLITFPKMEVLKTLCICPKYAFLSEFKNPHSKKARVISVDVYNREEPFKIAIKFSQDLPNLRRLVCGNLVDIEDLLFSSVRKLTEFRCGSYWNLSITFPGDGSRKTLLESNVTEFQFPDALKDPLFAVQAAKHFPNVKKVWLYLPSVPVLRAFFKAFENSQVEELYLKTQFDFANTMESCLLPNMRDVLRKSEDTETIVQTLKEYKHFDEYVRYYNIELPVEAEDLMQSHSAGIGALKNLKVLHLEHIPRSLLIPIPDDERKWYDHNCKFMNSTFGYEAYPLNRKCHDEILKLDLREYIWKNIQIKSSFQAELHDAGFVDMPEISVLREVYTSSYVEDDDEYEDIFEPVRSSSKGNTNTQVKIMPSMLLASFKPKPEGD